MKQGQAIFPGVNWTVTIDLWAANNDLFLRNRCRPRNRKVTRNNFTTPIIFLHLIFDYSTSANYQERRIKINKTIHKRTGQNNNLH